MNTYSGRAGIEYLGMSLRSLNYSAAVTTVVVLVLRPLFKYGLTSPDLLFFRAD
jgi:hypothetical protein